jgi:hypothetical protein
MAKRVLVTMQVAECGTEVLGRPDNCVNPEAFKTGRNE